MSEKAVTYVVSAKQLDAIAQAAYEAGAKAGVQAGAEYVVEKLRADGKLDGSYIVETALADAKPPVESDA